MTDYRVVDVTPVPPMQYGRRAEDKYKTKEMPWESLVEVGMSFIIPMPVGEAARPMQPFLRRAAASHGMRISTRRTTEGLQVWRIV